MQAKKKRKPVYRELFWTGSGRYADPCKHDFHDVTDGLTAVAGKLELDQLNPQLGKRPLFSAIDSGRLMQLMVAANRLITGVYDIEIDARHRQARLVVGAR